MFDELDLIIQKNIQNSTIIITELQDQRWPKRPETNSKATGGFASTKSELLWQTRQNNFIRKNAADSNEPNPGNTSQRLPTLHRQDDCSGVPHRRSGHSQQVTIKRALLERVDDLQKQNDQLETQLEQQKNLEQDNQRLRIKQDNLQIELEMIQNSKDKLIESQRTLQGQLLKTNQLNLNLEQGITAKKTLHLEISETNRQITQHQKNLQKKIIELDQIVVDQHLEKWIDQATADEPELRTGNSSAAGDPETHREPARTGNDHESFQTNTEADLLKF